jgi:biopolymer transport protein ExbD
VSRRGRGMSAQSGASGGGGEGEIDLTPMLDVVFIMLIFFIVTSSFVKEPGADINKADALTTISCVRGTIIFAINASGEIYYDKKQLPIGRAFRLGEAAKKEAPKANIVIQADVDAPTSVLSELTGVLKPLMDAPLCVSTNEVG